MRRIWRDFVAAFWAAYEEASGEAHRQREALAQLEKAQQAARKRREAAEQAMREVMQDLSRRRERIRAELVESPLLKAKTDGRVH